MDDEQDKMSAADEEYYSELNLMFQTVGWKLFVEELTANYKAVDSLNGVDTAETLWKNKGQLLVLANIINLEAVLAASEAADGDDFDNTEDEDTVH